MAVMLFKYVVFVWKQLHLFLIRNYYWDQCWFYDSSVWDLGDPTDAIDENKWIIQGIVFANLCVCDCILPMMQGFSGWERFPGRSKEDDLGEGESSSSFCLST